MDKWKELDVTEEFIRSSMLEQIPESDLVNEKIEQAYEELRRMQHMEMLTKEGMEEKKGRRADAFRHTTAIRHTAAVRYTAAAIALCLMLVIWLVENPTLAAQLPIIGHIFKDLEQKVSYPGDYSQHSASLSAETNTQGKNGGQGGNGNQRKNDDQGIQAEGSKGDKGSGKTENQPAYQVTSGNMTITLTEVSYDSNAIYLAMLAENKNGFASNAQINNKLYLDCQVDMYRTDGSKKTFNIEYGNSLAFMAEGEFVDANTFKGIVQLTSQELRLSDYTGCDIAFVQFRQELTTGKKMTGKLPGESETIAYLEYDWKTYDGNWKFHLDFPKMENAEKEIIVNQVNEQGFGIEKVVKTEYEIYAVPILPDGKNKADYVVTIWDADEKPLESHGNTVETRSIYDRDTSKVTVYLLSWEDFSECKGKNAYRQPEKAVYKTTVEFPE